MGGVPKTHGSHILCVCVCLSVCISVCKSSSDFSVTTRKYELKLQCTCKSKATLCRISILQQGRRTQLGRSGSGPTKKSHAILITTRGWVGLLSLQCNISSWWVKPCNLINELSCTGVASYLQMIPNTASRGFTSDDSIINDVIMM